MQQNMAALQEDPLTGTSIGSYRIAEVVGEGGMGTVYRAEHPEIGARVAIKVLAHDLGRRPDAVARFFNEARAVNLIKHEKIVDVLDLGTLADGRPYIVMELVDGEPLSHVIEARAPLPVVAFARFVGEVLEAIGAAHAKGVVHRDLKPDNLFVTPAGHAKVLDFGIAKLSPELDTREVKTRSGAVVGTPHYMAPEQVVGDDVDARADLYAVGALLFEGLTGKPPFDGKSTFDVMRQHVDRAVPSVARDDVPPALDAVVTRALAKQPDARFPDARAMADALADAIRELPAGEPLVAKPRHLIREREPKPRAPVHAPLAATVPVRNARQPVVVEPRGKTLRARSPDEIEAPTEAPNDAPRSRRGWIAGAVIGSAAIAIAAYVIGRGSTAATASDAAVAAIGSDPTGLDAATEHVEASDASVGVAPDLRGDASVAAVPVRDGSVVVGPARGAGVVRTPDAAIAPDDATTTNTTVAPVTGFDVTASLPRAYDLARAALGADAHLTSLKLRYVGRDGLLDPTEGAALYAFRSPKASVRTHAKLRCKAVANLATIRAGRQLPVWEYDDEQRCRDPLVARPRCSLARVWAKAIAAGVSDPIAFDLDYVPASTANPDTAGGGVWHFKTRNSSETFPDDC